MTVTGICPLNFSEHNDVAEIDDWMCYMQQIAVRAFLVFLVAIMSCSVK